MGLSMKKVLQIHIPRTAGTSMHVWALNEFPDHQCFTSWRGHRIKTWKVEAFFNLDSAWTSAGHLDQRRLKSLLKKKVFTAEWLESRFTFLFVRNSWDRLRSLYDFYRKSKSRSKGNLFLVDFETFLHRCAESTGYEWPGPARFQSNYFGVKPNFIGRFESLEEDWNRLLDIIGWQGNRKLMHRRFVRGNDDWRRSYTDVTRRYVSKYWAEEIERFGFVFDQ